MKRLNPRPEDVARVNFIKEMGKYSKFKKLWGTTFIDGIEVFTPRHMFYTGGEVVTSWYTPMITVCDDMGACVETEGEPQETYIFNMHSIPETTLAISEEYGFTSNLETSRENAKGVESMWIKLDPFKDHEAPVDFDSTILASKLSNIFPNQAVIFKKVAPVLTEGTYVPSDVRPSINFTAGTYSNPLEGNSGWSYTEPSLGVGDKLYVATRVFEDTIPTIFNTLKGTNNWFLRLYKFNDAGTIRKYIDIPTPGKKPIKLQFSVAPLLNEVYEDYNKTIETMNIPNISLVSSIADTQMKSSYQNWWNSYIIDSEEEGLASFIARYIGFTSSGYTVEQVTQTPVNIKIPYGKKVYITASGSYERVRSKIYSTKGYSVVIELQPTLFTYNSPLVVKLKEDLNYIRGEFQYVYDIDSNERSRVLNSEVSKRALVDGDGNEVDIGINFSDLNNLWYKKGNDYYLKVQAYETLPKKLSEKNMWLLGSIGSGYKKKKVSTVRKVGMVFTGAVLAFIGFKIAGPAGAAAGASAALITTNAIIILMVKAATYVIITAMVLTVIMLAAAIGGHIELASAIGKFLDKVDPLVKISNIILIIFGIGKIISAAKQAATEAAKQAAMEAGREVAQASLKDIAIEAVKLVIEKISLTSSFSNITLEQTVRYVNMVFNVYSDYYLKDLQKDINSLERQAAEYEELKEETQIDHIMLALTKKRPQPIDDDMSVYAELYDKPYEPYSTLYHTGNIQRNSIKLV